MRVGTTEEVPGIWRHSLYGVAAHPLLKAVFVSSFWQIFRVVLGAACAAILLWSMPVQAQKRGKTRKPALRALILPFHGSRAPRVARIVEEAFGQKVRMIRARDIQGADRIPSDGPMKSKARWLRISAQDDIDMLIRGRVYGKAGTNIEFFDYTGTLILRIEGPAPRSDRAKKKIRDNVLAKRARVLTWLLTLQGERRAKQREARAKAKAAKEAEKRRIAQKLEEERRRKAEQERKRKLEEERRRKAEQKRKAEQERKRKLEEERRRKAEQERKRKLEEERRRKAEQKRKAEQERKRKLEEERRRKAEQERKQNEESEPPEPTEPEEPESEEPEPEPEEERPTAPPPPSEDNSKESQPSDEQTFASVQALFGIYARTGRIRVLSGADRVYRSGVYPMGGIGSNLRIGQQKPSKNLWFAHLGFMHSLFLKSEVDGDPEDLRTRAWNLEAALSYARVLRAKQAARKLGLNLGLRLEGGLDAFLIDSNTAFPSTRYGYLGVGPFVEVRGKDLPFVVRAELAMHFAPSAGEIAQDFGEKTRAVGVRMRLSLEGHLPLGFLYGFRIDYRHYALLFRGPAGEAIADRGSDLVYGASILLGWVW